MRLTITQGIFISTSGALCFPWGSCIDVGQHQHRLRKVKKAGQGSGFPVTILIWGLM